MSKSSRRKRIIAVGGAVAFLAIGIYGFTVFARPATPVDPSRLATVEKGDIARSVVATGRIEPVTKVEIKSKANGIIKELKVQVGDRVVEGQVLAELDRDNLAARLRESRAALSGAEANLKAAAAELAKNRVEAQGPEVAFARRNVESGRAAGAREADLPAEHGRCPDRPRPGGEPPGGGELAAGGEPRRAWCRPAPPSPRRRRRWTAPKRS